jgi:hypothetical protein
LSAFFAQKVHSKHLKLRDFQPSLKIREILRVLKSTHTHAADEGLRDCALVVKTPEAACSTLPDFEPVVFSFLTSC